MKQKAQNFFVRWLTKEWAPIDNPLSDFDRILHEIRPCDVILVEGRNRVSSIIQHLTRSPWSHAALYIGRLHDISDPSLRAEIVKRLDCEHDTQLILEGYLGEGFRAAPLSIYKHDHIRICRPKGLAYNDAQAVIKHGILSIDNEYSVRQIIDLARFLLPWSILPRRWGSSLFNESSSKHSDICSSMIAEAFIKVDFPILPDVTREGRKIILRHKNSRLFIPSDFDYSPFFEIIKYPLFNISDHAAIYRKLPWAVDKPTKDPNRESGENKNIGDATD